MLDSLDRFLQEPHWRSQAKWRKSIWNGLARVGLTGVHGLPVNRRWVDIARRRMPLENLDASLDGFKIVQLSDLHYSPVVWQRYLVQFVRWVNELQPDAVVVTGDLVTGGYRYSGRVARILKQIKAPHGVICTLGNHDYSMYGRSDRAEGRRRANHLEQSLRDQGLICLRNQTIYLRRNPADRPIAIVGLDDEWTGHLNAERAFAGVDASLPIICLNHNPANVRELLQYPWQWMLSGHTHGRQVATSRFGRRFYPQRYRHYTHGYYAVEGRHLYVNRGLSYGQRVFEWCRPEITAFKLEVAVAGVTPAVEVGENQACND